MSDDPAARIRKALGSIVKHWDATLEPVRRAPGSHVKTSREPPLPISADVLDKRAMCCSRMAGWCLVVIEDRDLHTEHLSGLDVFAMADLLKRHCDFLGEHQAVADVVAELEASARDIAGLSAPRRREWMSLGTCPLVGEVEGEPTPCLGTIRAYPDADPYCDGCGIVAVVSWWERMQFPEMDELSRLATARELVAFIHKQFGQRVQEPTIRKWVERGWITVAGCDDKGRTLYDKGAVAYAVTRRKVVA